MAAVWPRSSVWPCCPGVHHVSSLLLKAWLFHGVITSLEAFRWLMASGYQIRLQLWAINGALPVGNVEVGVDRDCSGMAGGYPIPGVHVPSTCPIILVRLQESWSHHFLYHGYQSYLRLTQEYPLLFPWQWRWEDWDQGSNIPRVLEIHFRINQSPFTLSFSLLHLAGCSRIWGLAHARYTLLSKY